MKRHVLTGWFLVVLGVLALPARAEGPDPVEAELRARVQAFHAAASQGDLAAMSALFSQQPEVMLIGSDSGEVFVGHAAVVQFWGELFHALEGLGYPNGGLPTVSSGDALTVGRQDGMAWAADFPTWRFNGGDVPFRVTLVLRKERGEWKIVQVHFSLGVSNTQLPL